MMEWRSDNLLKFRQELFDTFLNFRSFKKVIYEDKESHVTTKSIKESYHYLNIFRYFVIYAHDKFLYQIFF